MEGEGIELGPQEVRVGGTERGIVGGKSYGGEIRCFLIVDPLVYFFVTCGSNGFPRIFVDVLLFS